MILLRAAKMPDELDKSLLVTTVKLLFPHPENEGYIGEIADRKNAFSACESLFALALLYEQIRNLQPTADTGELIFARSEMGKPYFKNSDVKFNISHSKGIVACAASFGEELGLDVESSVLTAERVEKMTARYFCADTAERIGIDAKSFARAWSEIEARAKFSSESVANILSQSKKDGIFANDAELSLHRFSFRDVPITLCTKRDFSTISYTVQ